jgi:predicted enzyme related to lactoylglutathione lyase
MTNPNMILLYVGDTAASAAFYGALLDREGTNHSGNFATVPLEGGMTLGLWARDTVKPSATAPGTQGEIVFMVEGQPQIDALYADWQARGLAIAQELTVLDFGPTFVALDPDGHRLRVCLQE